jgi:hypothetical protein
MRSFFEQLAAWIALVFVSLFMIFLVMVQLAIPIGIAALIFTLVYKLWIWM